MLEQEQRAAVVAEARRWIGTPYHHQADVLGAGVDCGMLLVRVYVDTGIVPAFDPRPYAVQWHLHRDDERYLGCMMESSEEVETPEPGDMAVWKIGRAYAHGAIVVGWPLVTVADVSQIALVTVGDGPKRISVAECNLTIIGNGSGIASFQQASLITVGNGSGIADIAQSAISVVGDGTGKADITQTFVSVVGT